MFKLIVTASITSFFFGLFGVDWDAVDEKIDAEYPTISFITSDELKTLYDSNSDLPVIIDVRESKEFQVSHLRSALNIETGTEVANRFPDKDAPIIVYCSVGYRSAGIAAELESLGYSNVKNLRHSIFKWANEGNQLINDGGGTSKAHPFNRAWGNLLNSELHQYEYQP